MNKDDGLYLGHMLDTAARIAAKVEGRTRADFDANEDLRLALVHLIQVIGEAARRVGESTRAAHPDIPWKAIMGMRHRIVHDYMFVNEDIAWNVASREAPKLADQLRPLVPPLDEAT